MDSSDMRKAADVFHPSHDSNDDSAASVGTEALAFNAQSASVSASNDVISWPEWIFGDWALRSFATESNEAGTLVGVSVTARPVY